jgi:hypothetical protein
MPSRNQIDCFIGAPPLAVFSILSDIENRTRTIKSVEKIRLLTDPPIGSKSRFRELRNVLVPWRGRTLCILHFAPPDRISFNWRQLMFRTTVDIELKKQTDGTLLHIEVTVSTSILPGAVSRVLEAATLHQWQLDFADIKRHAEARSDPSWRGSLSKRRSRRM